MNTYLGACHQLTTADIKEDEIGGAAITYMEGFLWDPVEAKKAFVQAAHFAHKHERARASPCPIRSVSTASATSSSTSSAQRRWTTCSPT